MAIDKIISAPSGLDQIRKINEIIDAVNEGGGGGTLRNIGEIVQSTIPLNDSGLHLADGSMLLADGIYADFVHTMYQKSQDTAVTSYKADVKVHGSPTVESGYYEGLPLDIYSVSGFSTSNYLTFKTSLYSSTDWEFKLHMMVSTPATTQYIVNLGGSGAYSLLFAIVGSKFTLYASSNGTSWDMINGQKGTYTVLNNTGYYIKIGYDSDNNNYYVKYSTDDNTYTTDISVTNSNHFALPDYTNVNVNIGYSWTSNPCLGTIYMTDTSFYHMGDYGDYTWTAIYPDKPGFEESTFEGVVRHVKRIEEYGVCGKFVAFQNYIYLPKLSGFIEGVNSYDGTGDITEAGLPDHRHRRVWKRTNKSGNDTNTVISYSENQAGNGTYYSDYASVENPIYGNSDTVQPQSTKVLYYIVVANSIKTEIEVDIDNIATDLNNKANVDLSNTVLSNCKNIDGPFIPITINSISLSTSVGSYSHDLSSILPNDSYTYLVECTLSISSSNDTRVYVGTTQSPFTNNTYCGAIRSTSNCRQPWNTFTIPVYSNRMIYSQVHNAAVSSSAGITINGYRRMGTNN